LANGAMQGVSQARQGATTEARPACQEPPLVAPGSRQGCWSFRGFQNFKCSS